jgi:glutathione peroxidase
MASIGDFTVRDGDGRDLSLASFAGEVLLIVNTASRCGFTPQYAGLEALQREFGPRGFTVLGFPCNQFGAQEPGDAHEIAAFCQKNYAITFPLLAKIEVNGPQAHPLFDWLKTQRPGLFGTRRIKWNFTKFLVDRDGRCVDRFAPFTRPEKLRRRIEALLR